ncbi:GAD-like domain-containing protein [Acinetobacter bereziniae]|uniref:GAD-like domain-containing protein n=1 Tax=Acinetobacter bereziniae TaxID=106648 RepID=UPI001D0DEDD3|nr:GAD-like domain-containing protein [Acinetobacter bereziniae]
MSEFIMEDDFDYFYNDEGFGPPIEALQVDEDTLKKYENKLPKRLLYYWKEYGFSGWGNGLFWLVNPADYDDLLHKFLEKTNFLDKDELFVIARTAFGELFVWSKNSGESVTINPTIHKIFPRILEDDSYEPDFEIDIFFSSKNKERLDLRDEKNKLLFERAQKKLGSLNRFEIYGFVPALVFGGSMELENLKKVPVLAHLKMLAELADTEIYTL